MVATEQGSYYYHPDHLGSSSVVTDKTGKFYEQIEYFPYGETWIHNKATADQESVTYKFTAKELDVETGLYYYGYRYLDPKLSCWISGDPALVKGEYFPVTPVNDKAREQNSKLPGMGGVFNTINLDAYQYGGLNPVMLLDPDGNWIHIAAGAVVGGTVNGLAMYFGGGSSEDILIATGIGPGAGGVAAACMGTNIPANMVIAGAISSINSYLTQSATKDGKVNKFDVAFSGVSGMALGGYLPSKFSGILNETLKDEGLKTAYKGIMDSGLTILSSATPNVFSSIPSKAHATGQKGNIKTQDSSSGIYFYQSISPQFDSMSIKPFNPIPLSDIKKNK